MNGTTNHIKKKHHSPFLFLFYSSDIHHSLNDVPHCRSEEESLSIKIQTVSFMTFRSTRFNWLITSGSARAVTLYQMLLVRFLLMTTPSCVKWFLARSVSSRCCLGNAWANDRVQAIRTGDHQWGAADATHAPPCEHFIMQFDSISLSLLRGFLCAVASAN